ncbi:spore coat U domain-containing protein [Variovorax sp. J22R133]|uniref:Csu type fimbrial protein n=1 Tax=Variovorax brevis TaxID=3053503 RepID=UPI002578F6DD|nr:spore coat U domain-containing protein [Variovorax sp. J22R133]MDM0117587.1 spore coat U domain-containing protein [Variovorax sp. J22R133]
MKELRFQPTGRGAFLTLLALGLAAASGNALAAGACSVSSSGLAFGGYQPVTSAGKLNSVAATSTATVSVVCTAIGTNGSYTVSLGPGTYGPGDRIGVRYLNNATHGGEPMAFNVFTEATYGSVWGDGIRGGVLTGSIPSGNSSQTHTVYGRVPAGQTTLKAGSFSDSMTMTITYEP